MERTGILSEFSGRACEPSLSYALSQKIVRACEGDFDCLEFL